MSDSRRDHGVTADLHLHSDVSDGVCSPEELARRLSQQHAEFASLTDHESTDGLEAFSKALEGYGITGITGTEISAQYQSAEVHLLVYGFDPQLESLQRCFHRNEHARRVIDAAHEAGGIVFLAHPLQTGWDEKTLASAVHDLAEAGLDGIEAFYKPYAKPMQDQLAALADKYGLLTCGGSDCHTLSDIPGVTMPSDRWKQFSRALSSNGRVREPRSAKPAESPVPLHWRRLLFGIVLPSLLVITAFLVLIFGVLIPKMEELLIESRREMTAELTNSAWSILNDYDRLVREGSMDLTSAQDAAVERIRRMRYGSEGKDYFWITDMHPVMVMHPYRSDLEGRDLTDFTDPQGVRLFVEFVEEVKRRSSGYVSYVWQWQDDPDRMEAKESYIRGFAPWGWIIGTGLYVDDLYREIETVTGRAVDISFIVILLALMLLAWIWYQALNNEKRRSSAESELHRSHERYRALVESSASGTLLLAGGRCSYANSTLLDLLGYSAGDLAFLDVSDLFASGGIPEALAGETEVKEPVETSMRCRNGRIIPVLVSSAEVYFSGTRALMLNVQDMTRQRDVQFQTARRRLMRELQSSQMFLTEPVSRWMEKPVTVSMDTPIQKAVRILGSFPGDALAVVDKAQGLVGIVTDRDIRRRVVEQQLDTGLPVSRIMSSPVVTVHEHAPLFEACVLEHDHLPAVDDAGNTQGMLRCSRAFRPERYSLSVLQKQLRTAGSLEDLASFQQQIQALCCSLTDSGASAQSVCHVITSASDEILRRAAQLAQQQLGEAPAPYVFLALGSEARYEQTLATDQDNALIYGDTDAEDAKEYFIQLGELVCDTLDAAGYRYCRGGTMAKNPEWNKPLGQWKKYFTAWTAEPEGTALSRCGALLDMRPVCGSKSLAAELKQHAGDEIESSPGFLSHMAMQTLRYKSPVGLFGRLVPDGPEDRVNIKEAMIPIVEAARLYALKHRLNETGTFDRLERLYEIGVLKEEVSRGMSQAYDQLMQLRLRHQVGLLHRSLPPDNSIDPQSLASFESDMLRRVFSEVGRMKKKISLDFRISDQ